MQPVLVRDGLFEQMADEKFLNTFADTRHIRTDERGRCPAPRPAAPTGERQPRMEARKAHAVDYRGASTGNDARPAPL
ncbi:hypothetical protein ACFXCZ_09400 [Streptomyces sp. NPDC059396]|uniref:hypothetical protein n=1 Tax=Streptomyces sp. NPDC059396 TaxID=3346819 RepID=UPI003685A9DD